MNDELQEALATMIERSMEVAQSTGEWALDKAPELIHQFLMWELWASIFFILICVVYMLLGIKIIPYTARVWTNILDHSEGMGIATGLYVIGFVLATIATIWNTYKALHILVAPEIYLIKYFL